jgi:ketosteroid isomerase-like protein/mannose-6-phosphate isomerase-like protein (cupin superfamily)
MSQENVDMVRRVYEEWSRGDFSAGELFDPDVEFDMVDWPGRAKARGVPGMRQAWVESLRAWEDFRAEPGEFIESGQNVVVPTHVTARGRGSGAEVTADTATVWTFDGGRVTRLALHWDAAAALEAMGLGSGAAATTAFTIKNLMEVEDSGLVSGLEARVARSHLDSEHLGVSHFRYAPGVRTPFGHSHGEQEEAYVVVRGSGRARIGDEIVALRRWDVLRVAPQAVRALEGGPDGMELIAVGSRLREDDGGQTIEGFWPSG